MIELKKREEGDGTLMWKEEEPRASQTQPTAKRMEIEATLARLRCVDHGQRQREAEAREAQRDATRSLVKLMHLDTADQTMVAQHTGVLWVIRDVRVAVLSKSVDTLG